MEVVIVGDDELMPVFNPPPALVAECHQHFQAALAYAEATDKARNMLIRELVWFSQDEARCRAQGFDTMYEMLGDERIAKGFWGRTATSRNDRSRLRRIVDVASQVPEVDVMDSLPKSITSTPMMSVIEQEAKSLPALEAPERPAAVQAFKSKLDEIGARTHRENVTAGKAKLLSEFTYDAKSGIVTFTNGSGPQPTLKLNPQAGNIAAVVLNRAVPVAIESLTMDADKLVAWIGNKPVVVGDLITQDDKALNALADIVHAVRG